MIAETLKKMLVEASHTAFPHVAVPGFSLVHPENPDHGDYAANIALIMSKMVHMNPFDVAEKIVSAFPHSSQVSKVEAVRPGFINIHFSQGYFVAELERVLTLGESYGIKPKRNERILLEFGQPNTHKMPHIGHMFSYIYGESLARLLEFTGSDVIRLNYQGDVGPHVAKCLWAHLNNRKRELGIHPPLQLSKESNYESLRAPVLYLQECYQKGSKAYEDDPVAKSEIDELNNRIYSQDPDILPIWRQTRQWSLDFYAYFESLLGIHYDKGYLESEVGNIGLEKVRQATSAIFEEDQGAVVFRGEHYGLHTRVFISRAGNPTYEGKEIGLFAAKIRDWAPFELSVVTTASEQNEYWQVVKKAAELVYPDLVGKIKHIGFGLITLSTGKMSSRTGEFVSAIALRARVISQVQKVLETSGRTDLEDSNVVAQKIAMGAIKYTFLKSSPTKNMAFDIETSIASEGNSGPYLQYTYARTQSLLRKAGERDIAINPEYAPNEEEMAVLRSLARYDEVVSEAAAAFGPHIVAQYLFDLAQRYSYFYNQHQVVSDDDATTGFRLSLTRGVGLVLEAGLKLLGIEVLERI